MDRARDLVVEYKKLVWNVMDLILTDVIVLVLNEW